MEKDFENNIKNKENLYFYKKFSPIVNHIRYEDNYRFEKKESKLIFNFIKNKSDKNIILFQGDSWFQQINEFKGMKNFNSFSYIWIITFFYRNNSTISRRQEILLII